MPSVRWGRGPPVNQCDGSGSDGVHHAVLPEVYDVYDMLC